MQDDNQINNSQRQKQYFFQKSCTKLLAVIVRSASFARAWIKRPFEKQSLQKRGHNKLFVSAVVMKK